MSANTLVRILADGEFHSGADLGAALGLGRAAVWKQVGRLSEQGIDVQAVRGKGYRVQGGLDLLDADVIRAAIAPAASAQLAQLDVFGSVDSTNTVAMSRSRVGGGCYACLAERQTAGRGRRGRAWESPYAASLYLSVLREFPGGVAVVEGLSIAVGVVIAEVLVRLGVAGTGLKWPNDIVVGPEKLGGILIELTGDFGGSCRAVIGVGVNVAMPSSITVDQPWTDIRRQGAGVSRNPLAAALLSALVPALDVFEAQGLSPFLQRWAAFDVLRGRAVTLYQADGRQQHGIADGIEASGALRVLAEDGLLVARGGEVSVRATA